MAVNHESPAHSANDQTPNCVIDIDPLGEFDLALSICPIHDQTYCSNAIEDYCLN
jgi:hypothetical protein